MCLRKLWTLHPTTGFWSRCVDSWCILPSYLLGTYWVSWPSVALSPSLPGFPAVAVERAYSGQSTCLPLHMSAVFPRLCPRDIQTQTEHCLVLSTVDTGCGNEQKDTTPTPMRLTVWNSNLGPEQWLESTTILAMPRVIRTTDEKPMKLEAKQGKVLKRLSLT